MKLALKPTDWGFAQNLAELADAVRESRPFAPSYFRVSINGEEHETRMVRYTADGKIAALSKDELHEATFELAHIDYIIPVFQPRAVLCLVGPDRQLKRPSIHLMRAYPGIGEAREAALHFSAAEIGKYTDFTALLRAVRESSDYDIAIEEI